mmetsp:Transcript_43827/g.86414  ORF Transcript_43827/g.86414 Transcript_43827/m.86414 type:complete len:271 (+) Transcript_43827:25-837(+)|eukprot:CAMPEP_0171841298 /NCGR_PEP_ID=MMETSP0992-20121227/14493_1 /TAXON_ID=483369 /ORGANISM="non described non described, Strain CCMP2098" /LENGTH=270 /DNA_ID=CAMNT_0012458281 /DNA_START=27 /DNA_END=839 /DNA_ORIENTATION=-
MAKSVIIAAILALTQACCIAYVQVNDSPIKRTSIIHQEQLDQDDCYGEINSPSNRNLEHTSRPLSSVAVTIFLRCRILSLSGGSSSAKIQWMVTQRMRTELLALQYTEEEVDAISPDIAKVVVERGLPRPASGMPPTWSRSAATKKRHMGRKKAGRGGGRLISRVVRALNPVPLVAKTVTIPARILGALFQSTEMRAVLTQAVTSGLVVAGLVFFRRQNPLEPQQKATPPTSRFQNRPMMPRFATFGRKRKQGVANVDEDQYEDEEEPLF